ncbi:MAG: helix-turn-helix transcriptional regulator [Anaerorhabdus sp.]|uniref:helix-turn-helix domain-containing protein n=1 Tax=Anaerorhabdus sp. TaxID=1872524 RepID=UPI002FC6D73F
MIDVKALKKLLIDKGKTMRGLANYLGISKSTLYRKLNGESDFYREEMQKAREYLEENNLDFIFFA